MSNPVSQQATGSATITLTPEERSLYGTLFRQYDAESLGIITGEAARSLFESSGLPPAILGEIWQLSDNDNKGFLDHIGFSSALRLIGHVQSGKRPKQALINTPGQLPRFKGVSLEPHLTGSHTGGASGSPQLPLGSQLPVPHPSASPVISAPAPTRPTPTGVLVPPLTAADKTRFIQLFKNSAPNGALDGSVAKDIFLKAKLSNEVLGQVWNLADTQRRGQLNQTEFTVAMHLIQCVLNGSLKSIPAVLPPSLYTAADEGDSSQTNNDSLSVERPVSNDINRQPTGPSSQSTPVWTISALEKSRYDAMFESIDKSHRGIIGAQEVVPFLTTSKLPEDVLAQIWDLSDRHNTGEFTKTEFSIAMYFTQQKLAGRDLPLTLPESLVSAALGKNAPANPIMNDQSGIDATKPPLKSPGSALNDLVSLNDLFTSPPPASPREVPTAIPAMTTGQSSSAISSLTTGSRGGFVPVSSFGQNLQQQQQQKNTETLSSPVASVNQPQFDKVQNPVTNNAGYISRNIPENDDLLLGNDSELSSKLSTATTEFANFSNQISSLTAQTTNLKAKREKAEAELANLVGRKQEIEGKLGQLRGIFDGEVKKVSQVEQLLASNRQETSQLSQEFSTIEAEYQSVLAQYQTTSTAYESDKQENLALKQQIAITNAEIVKLKEQLEVVKKEARQQRGFVAINQKQLAVLQTETANVTAEIEVTKNEILEQKVLQQQLEQQILEQQTLQQNNKQERSLQQQAFEQQQTELQCQRQVLQKEQETLKKQQQELELQKQQHQQQLQQQREEHQQQQEQHRQQQQQHLQQHEQLQKSIVTPAFDNFIPSPTGATIASSTRDGSHSPGNPFFNVVAPTAIAAAGVTQRDFEQAFDGMSMDTANLSTGGATEVFALPIMRPQSASSSVQNNPSMSVRGDEEFSRPESPVSTVSAESESAFSIPSVYNHTTDDVGSNMGRDSDSESHHLGKPSGEFYAETYHDEDDRFNTAKASVLNDNEDIPEKFRQTSVATIKPRSASAFSESDNGFQEIEEGTEPSNKDIIDNESDVKGKEPANELEDSRDEDNETTNLKSSGESSFEIVQVPEDYEDEKEYTETNIDQPKVDTNTASDHDSDAEVEAEPIKEKSDRTDETSQIPGGWVSSTDVDNVKVIPGSAETNTNRDIPNQATDDKAKFDSIFSSLTEGSTSEAHTTPHASFPVFGGGAVSEKPIAALDNEHFTEKFPSLPEVNETKAITQPSNVQSEEINEGQERETKLVQSEDDEGSSSDEEGPEEIGSSKRNQREHDNSFENESFSDEEETTEKDQIEGPLKHHDQTLPAADASIQSPFTTSTTFAPSSTAEAIPQLAFEQDDFNSAFADLDEAKPELNERSAFDDFIPEVGRDDGFDDFDTAFENMGPAQTESSNKINHGFESFESEPKDSSDDWEQIFAGFSKNPASTVGAQSGFSEAIIAPVTNGSSVPNLPPRTLPGTESYVNEFSDAMRQPVSHHPDDSTIGSAVTTRDTKAIISTGNSIHDKHVEELVSLGFEAEAAKHALAVNDWNLSEASNWLLDNA